MIFAASALEEVGHVVRAVPAGGSAAVGRPAIEQLVTGGAVLYTPHSETFVLIGDARWTKNGALLLFSAFGERNEDITCIHDANVARVGESGVMWFQSGAPIFQLSAIEHAPIADPDDYRIAWALWQQVVPLRRELIERCFDTIEAQVDSE